MANIITMQEFLRNSNLPELRQPDSRISLATKVLIARNISLNKSNPDLHLSEETTPNLENTAKRLAALQEQLKIRGGEPLVRSFMRDSYNILWFEQISQIDQKKIVLATETKTAVDTLIQDNHIDKQHAPAMALGAFVGIEKLEELELTYVSSRMAIKKINEAEKNTPPALKTEKALLRHMQNYLSDLDQTNPMAVGIEREAMIRDQIALDIARRLERQNKHVKILKQSQGSEVEMLQRLDYLTPEKRVRGSQQYRLGWVDRFNLKDWLPRGIRKDQHKRMDWHLTHMLGLPEDVAEKIYDLEWYEVTTKPTESGANQSTLLYELVLGGFVSEDILSNTWEKYSVHISTVFPSTIWNDKSEKQYLWFARGFAGAFSSIQRGVYGGYVSNDSNGGRSGREIANKTFQANKMTSVEGAPNKSIQDMHLVEIRMFDLTEKGQYAVEIYKQYFDFAFRCHWSQQEGLPLASSAEYQAANLWKTFNIELQQVYERYNIEDDWKSVGWTKSKNPQLQTDLVSLYRNFGHKLINLVDKEVQAPEPIKKIVEHQTPILLEKRKFLKDISTSKEKSDPKINLSAADMTKLHLTDQQFVTFRLGESKISARINQADQKTSSSEITLSPTICESIHLWDNLSLSMRYDPTRNEISIGPTIGIMVNQEDLSVVQPFNDQTRFLANNLQIAQKNGMAAYLFDPHSLDFENHTINAWILSPDKQSYQIITVPYPDVIYDRTFHGRANSEQELKHIPFLNPREFTEFIADKLELPQLLRANTLLKDYIPETRQFVDAQSITDMLSTNRVVFFKPTWGMASMGVVKIERLDDGSYRYNYTRPHYDNEGNIDYGWPEPAEEGYHGFIAHSTQEILDKTKDHRKNYRDFVIQQGIDMPYDKSWGFFETRFLLQRGATGSLNLIGWNEGQKNHDIGIFGKHFGETNATNILTNAERLAKAVSLQIQKDYGSHFGQMTVQVGIDRTGKVWFLEANPKPGVVNQFDNRNLPHLTDQSIEHTLKYQHNMSGFSEQSTPTKRIDTVTLKNGYEADVYEESNPFTIYRFAVEALGENITDPENSVFNLRHIEKIKQNLARRARYVMMRDKSTGKILGCVTILRPSPQGGFEIDTKKPMVTRWRWEIGGVLTHPDAKNQGIAGILFDQAVTQIRQAQPVYDTDNKRPVDEIRVDVTGTYDKDKMGLVRTDSVGIDKIVQRYPNRKIGAVYGSYGPMYAIPITSK